MEELNTLINKRLLTSIIIWEGEHYIINMKKIVFSIVNIIIFSFIFFIVVNANNKSIEYERLKKEYDKIVELQYNIDINKSKNRELNDKLTNNKTTFEELKQEYSQLEIRNNELNNSLNNKRQEIKKYENLIIELNKKLDL